MLMYRRIAKGKVRTNGESEFRLDESAASVVQDDLVAVAAAALTKMETRGLKVGPSRWRYHMRKKKKTHLFLFRWRPC